MASGIEARSEYGGLRLTCDEETFARIRSHILAEPTVAEESVLRRLRAGNHNLLVMGVSPRPGESLAFGHVAAAVLARSEHSILFVSS